MFHTATFELLGSVPSSSLAAIVEIEKAEARLDLKLPAAVREWYSYERAIEILYEHSNDDPPIPLAKFVTKESSVGLLLPFRNENQGVCVWAVLLDGSDDPPVFVDVDSRGRGWHMLAPKFSEYVWICVWDKRVVHCAPMVALGQTDPMSAEAVKRLARLFRVEPQTHGWPGSTQYRFSGERCAVLIWSAESEADWFVGAQDEVSLESALTVIWNINNVGRSLFSKDAELVIERVAHKMKPGGGDQE